MKEINIGRVIMRKRREKGLTQEDLASYMGVSKASVSKWETGMSYPDVAFLPQLAAYFNISIDELMGYKPQMTKVDIRRLYIDLSSDFATKPFDEVMNRCREMVKEYFACFPLLFQMGALLLNHSMLPGDREKTAAVLSEAKALFVRVKKESGDVALLKQAITMEAVCTIALGNPQEVLDLLEGNNTPLTSCETLLASAYQMMSKVREAKTVLQIGIYQYMLGLIELLRSYLTLCADDADTFNEILRRACAVADAFDVKGFHPTAAMTLYLVAAQGFAAQGDVDGALDFLEKYVQIATGSIFPITLHGDGFFNLLDEWFADFPLGSAPPRDEKTIMQSVADAVANNPAFEAFAGEFRFQSMVGRLKYIWEHEEGQNESRYHR